MKRLVLIILSGVSAWAQVRISQVPTPPPGDPLLLYGGNWNRLANEVPSGLTFDKKEGGADWEVVHKWTVRMDDQNTIAIDHLQTFRQLVRGTWEEKVNEDESYTCTFTFTGLPAPIDLEPDQYKDIDFFITAKASKEKRDCTLRDPNAADPWRGGFVRARRQIDSSTAIYTISQQFGPERYSTNPTKPYLRKIPFDLGFRMNWYFPMNSVMVTLVWQFARSGKEKTLGTYMGGGVPPTTGGTPVPPPGGGSQGPPGGAGSPAPYRDDCSDVCPPAGITLLCVESGTLDPGAPVSDTCRKCRAENACGEEAAQLISPVEGTKLQDVTVTFTWTSGGRDTKETQLLVGASPLAGDRHTGPWGKATSAAVTLPAKTFIFVTLKTRTNKGMEKKKTYQFETEAEAGLSMAKMAVNTFIQGDTFRAMAAPQADACRLECVNNPQCQAYTYWNPGFRQEGSFCELKSAARAKTIDRCCVSGMRGDIASLPLTGATAPPQPPPPPPQPPPPRTATLPPPGPVQTVRAFKILGSRVWSDTGIDVQPGMQIQITATGAVDIGGGRWVEPSGVAEAQDPRLPLPNAARGALIAKLAFRNGGESGVVFVGARNTLTVDAGEYGRLLLGINDDSPADNRGEFVVRLSW